jgi:rubredoxin---NAD+ reductase
MAPLVIIGTGLAGYSVAREVRKLDPELPIKLITADDGVNYSKPMLSNAYTSGKTPENLALADAVGMATQLKAEILTGTRVEAIHPEQNSLTLTPGNQQPYSQLVLALGADPIHIPIPGGADDRIYSVNDLIDYRRFRTALNGVQRVVIMGGGLIGCEFANDLLAAGIAAHVIDPENWPLRRLLPEAAGHAIQHALSAFGVSWHFGTVVKSVEPVSAGVLVTLNDGQQLDADLVLSAIGLRPRTQLARAAGLTVQRGIVVDRYLATSVPNIFALGDCIEVAGLVLPFIMPIMHASRALAQTLTGQPTVLNYPAMPVVVKTTKYPVVISPPKPEIVGEWVVEKMPPDGVKALYYDNDNLLQGFALTGVATAEKNALTKLLPAVLAA